MIAIHFQRRQLFEINHLGRNKIMVFFSITWYGPVSFSKFWIEHSNNSPLLGYIPQEVPPTELS